MQRDQIVEQRSRPKWYESRYDPFYLVSRYQVFHGESFLLLH